MSLLNKYENQHFVSCFQGTLISNSTFLLIKLYNCDPVSNWSVRRHDQEMQQYFFFKVCTRTQSVISGTNVTHGSTLIIIIKFIHHHHHHHLSSLFINIIRVDISS